MMVKYLLQRPVAVLVSFALCIGLGFYLTGLIPVSLLPNADVPEMVVQAYYANTPAPLMEERILKPMRDNLSTLSGLEQMETKAANFTGTVSLRFEYGTRMDLAFIEVNEKLDRLANTLPKDMPRPQVMRLNSTDIPVVRLQVMPAEEADMVSTTELTYKVLKRRLEQLPGVSTVDVNGGEQQYIGIAPDLNQLQALGLSVQAIGTAVRQANSDVGSLSLKDGQYRYFIRVGNTLSNPEDIGKIAIPLPQGGSVPLRRVADVKGLPVLQTGFHLYNGKQGLVITIQKTSNSRLNDLMPLIREVVEQFKTDYPAVSFSLTQDQSFLLDAGIGNLKQDLLYGGLFTIMLLFAFLGNWRSPLIMSISIPVSLLFTFILFKVFNISFNIISLSGLTLGIGNLIDNTVIVVDHIIRRRRQGAPVLDAAVLGTNEVVVPIISQVLTTVAVYAPLVILGGLAGILVWEQGIALTISLAVSLTVAFILAPLLYTFLFKNEKAALSEDTRFYRWVNKGYHRMIDTVLRYRLFFGGITLLLMPVGFFIAPLLPVRSLPPVVQTESLVQVDWNEPVDALENKNRMVELMQFLAPLVLESESETGIRQFLLQPENTDVQQGDLYFKTKGPEEREMVHKRLADWMAQNHPQALFNVEDAPNAFTQLFARKQAYIEARFRPVKGQQASDEKDMEALLKQLPVSCYTAGSGLVQATGYDLLLDRQKMQTYRIPFAQVEETLQQLFGQVTITELKRFGDVQKIQLYSQANDLSDKLQTPVSGAGGAVYPLGDFVSLLRSQQAKYITADKSGPYQSLTWEAGNPMELEAKMAPIARENGWELQMTGAWFQEKEQINALWLIFILVVLLLYFILVVQYESLLQPVIVMLTIPLGISGAMVILWLTGGSLNVMAAVGFIVVLGLIVDDPILKIETLNRLEKKYRAEGLEMNAHLLKRMIHEAGDICLKPLLMVSLTTSMAMLPVLLIPGIGNDLQKPLALVIIGGLTIGTFFTTWFIPLAYWYVRKGATSPPSPLPIGQRGASPQEADE